MEEDIQNYLPTVMFRGTPCISEYCIMFKVFNLKTLYCNFDKNNTPFSVEGISFV